MDLQPKHVQSFLDKILVGDDCWEWTGGKRKGYGSLRVGQRCEGAHRVSYEIFVGPIPEGLELDHLCRVPACVRPDHLEPVTHPENVARGEVGRVNRAKTHCPKGHPYDEVNTYHTPKGRSCRTCMGLRPAEVVVQ